MKGFIISFRMKWGNTIDTLGDDNYHCIRVLSATHLLLAICLMKC